VERAVSVVVGRWVDLASDNQRKASPKRQVSPRHQHWNSSHNCHPLAHQPETRCVPPSRRASIVLYSVAPIVLLPVLLLPVLVVRQASPAFTLKPESSLCSGRPCEHDGITAVEVQSHFSPYHHIISLVTCPCDTNDKSEQSYYRR
jgi:hypothetical protein